MTTIEETAEATTMATIKIRVGVTSTGTVVIAAGLLETILTVSGIIRTYVLINLFSPYKIFQLPR